MQASTKLRQCLSIQSPKVGISIKQHRCLATPSSPDRQPSPTPSPRTYPKFPTESLSYHWETTPPTPTQLNHASKFFKLQPPTFLWSAPKFKTMDFGDSPEVCFLGRSNVGKSSLLNALLCKKIAHTSSKPGRTKLMNAFAVGGPEDDGKNRLVVLDMPGYGKGGRAEWGKEILKYLSKRRQLKRAFLLVDAEHGVKVSDRQILALFKEHEVPYQIVLSKADKVLFHGSRTPSPDALTSRISELRRTMEKVRDAVQPDPENDDEHAFGEAIACSSEKWIEGHRMGIDAVRFAMLQAAGLELQQKTRLAKPVEIIPHDQIFG
ncbi:putative GTP-binding protein [Lachnellula willkommii]|uniref:GTP-binding protein 8 n=1 Tax=Lachnellula willkommii TaxID=215461 RepID=A0A559M4T0_9HELO|nr:putative GTP-binding protein [Lachnellula willkommii]